jgi:hypothetical protein
MSIASRTFLAAAFAAGLTIPGGAHAALHGFSLDLGTPSDPMTLDSGTGLSAEVAASNGKPAMELPNNLLYKTTLTGNYTVVDNLAGLDTTKPLTWRESYELTLNGAVIFTVDDILPSTKGEDIWKSVVTLFADVTGLPSADLPVIIGVLKNIDSFSLPPNPPDRPPGEFDYIYNTKDQLVGTFALGTIEPLGDKIVLNPENTVSFDFSAFVVPEPSTWVMLLLGFAGLGFVGYRQTRRAKPQAA